MTTLERVFSGKGREILHVVFVHGLNGNARSTWMHNPNDNKTLWPNWIGEEVGCSVWVAGYCAAPSGWTDTAMHLAELGEAFFAALQAQPEFQGQRIVLIGHSLGGLVIKSGMTQAKTLGVPLRLSLLDQIAGVVFIGTPHQGACLASIADNLRLLFKTNAPVTNMVKDDPWLKLLNAQFRHLQEQYKFGVRVFYESKGIWIGKKICFINFGRRVLIVDRNSSDPGIAGVIPTPIDGDHIEIAKPLSRQEFIHKSLVEFLNSVESASENTPPTDRHISAQRAKSCDLATKLRTASSQLLSWPSTLADGTWFDRPELDLLLEGITSELSSTHYVLGVPGSGKSSLLVRLAHERLAAGWCVLAIKADRLPPDILDRQALAKHLNLEDDTAAVLRSLASDAPVILIIDQVDALADLVVQHSARLRVLLDLVQDLDKTEGVHTVISCRTFEQKHDPALRNLNATPIRLELPEWTKIHPVLMAHGLQAEACACFG